MPLLAGLALPTAAATPVLRVLAWPGYVEPEVIEEFQKRHKVSVEVTVVDNDDTLLEKMRIGAGSGSGNFDLVAANTAEISRYAGAGWLQPIALNDIPARAGQAPRFLDYAGLPGLMQGGRVYGIPFTYAEMGLIYDRKAFVQPPDSIAVLWDERYRKKVLAFNGSSHNFSLAALRLGRPSPFNLAERDWPLAVDQLIALRRNVLVFYTQPEESADLFIRHKAVLMYANYGRQQLKLLTDRHADVGYVIPAEGALAWLDCWAITRGAGNVRLAHAFIDHMLGATASRLLESRQGLSSTKKAISMPAGKERQLHWLMPVENAEERTRLWQRILSGDTRNRVLQP
ncbi:MAG: extracellular solute-binding protein [Zoogloeaceae bacterium]|nr:extracellular solute-binding protein [Zoogloeaceae bacterium]